MNSVELPTRTIDQVNIPDQDSLRDTCKQHYEMYFRQHQHVLLLLTGELGAGKTTLVRMLGQVLAIQDNINSPTFNLCNEYAGAEVKLWHYDLYRLTDGSELGELDFEERWSGRMPDMNFTNRQDVGSGDSNEQFDITSSVGKRRQLHAIEWWQRAPVRIFVSMMGQVPMYQYQLEIIEKVDQAVFDPDAARHLTLLEVVS